MAEGDAAALFLQRALHRQLQRLLDPHAVEKVEMRPILGRADPLLELVLAQRLRRRLVRQQRLHLLGRQQPGRHRVAEPLAEQQPVERLALDQIDVLPPVDQLARDVPAPNRVEQRVEPGLAGAQRQLERDQVGVGVQRGGRQRLIALVFGDLREAGPAQGLRRFAVEDVRGLYAARPWHRLYFLPLPQGQG